MAAKKATKKVKSKTKVMRKKRTVGKSARKRTGTARKKLAKTAAEKARRQSTAHKAKPRITRKPKPIGARTHQGTKSTPSRPATPVSSEQRIGVITHYYSHLSVVAMQLEPGATLRVGDVIHIWGHTTDFTQKVESLEVDHGPVAEVGSKDDFGLKVNAHARERDIVFKIRS